MSVLADLREFPSTISTGTNGRQIHESCYRSYQLLQKVRDMLTSYSNVPQELIVEIIDDVMDAPQTTRELDER